MKLLVDTSVWSLALRRKDAASLSQDERHLVVQLTHAVQEGRVAIIGLIRQELLSGIKDQAQFEKLKTYLGPFQDEPLDTADHEEAARLYNECRSQGLEAGTVDLLICAVAMRRQWKVLSNDAGLERCLAAAGRLQQELGTSTAVEEQNKRRLYRKAGAKSRKYK